MSTHAQYYLWAGFLLEDHDDDFSDEFQTFLDILRSSYPGIEREGFLFTSVGMHGETIGFGVVLTDLDWITFGERPASPDTEQLGKLSETLEAVRTAFIRIGLPEEVPCNLYHHLDLGG